VLAAAVVVLTTGKVPQEPAAQAAVAMVQMDQAQQPRHPQILEVVVVLEALTHQGEYIHPAQVARVLSLSVT
jgi:hypothetical protein